MDCIYSRCGHKEFNMTERLSLTCVFESLYNLSVSLQYFVWDSFEKTWVIKEESDYNV